MFMGNPLDVSTIPIPNLWIPSVAQTTGTAVNVYTPGVNILIY